MSSSRGLAYPRDRTRLRRSRTGYARKQDGEDVCRFVRRWLIDVPARVVNGARQVFVRLAADMLWGEVFKRTYDRLTC